jgi:hypothetical protein
METPQHTPQGETRSPRRAERVIHRVAPPGTLPCLEAEVTLLGDATGSTDPADVTCPQCKEPTRSPGEIANLGLATTHQLLDEIAARIDVDYASGGGGLGYSTVHGRPALPTPTASPAPSAQDQLRALDTDQRAKDAAFVEDEEPKGLLFMQKVTVSAQGGFLDFPELLKPHVEMALAALHDRITRDGYTPTGEQYLAFYVEQIGEPR